MRGRFDLLHWPDDRRVGLLSLSSAAVLVVLMVTAITALLGPSEPFGDDPLGGHAPGLAVQPALAWPSPVPSPSGASPMPGPSASATDVPSSPDRLPAEPLTATFRTTSLLGLGGFDTTVVVRNPNAEAHVWTVVLVMPADHPVENRSPEVVTMVKNGVLVTLRPVAELAGSSSATFTVRLKTLLSLDSKKVTCTIDGNPCRRS